MKDLVSACPIEDVMRVLSGRWPTLLLYYLKDGTKRFSDLQRDNPSISHRMLTLELRKLELAGIISRTVFEGYPLRVEYDLTETGLKLVPLIDALGDWWQTAAPARRPPPLRSKSRELRPVLAERGEECIHASRHDLPQHRAR